MSVLKKLVAVLKPFIERFPRISMLYRVMRDQYKSLEEPKNTTWGFKLAGNSSMVAGTFEADETGFVRKALKDVEVLVNVGANIGYYCCHALSMGKDVIAFEPVLSNVNYLCKNIKANKWSGVEIFPIALTNKVDVLEIFGGGTGASILKGWAGTPESYSSVVPSSTMDLVLGERLKGKRVLVLVDVEGAEYSMLEGATKMLQNDPKPIWLMEITTYENQPAGVELNPKFKSTFQLFFQNGYSAYVLGKQLRLVSAEDIDLVVSGRQTLESHNFLFKSAV